MKKKTVITIVVIILLVAAGLVGFQFFREAGKSGAASDLETELAKKGDLAETIGETGSVRARQTVVITWMTSGTVENVFVDTLDEVSKDEALADLVFTSLSQNIIQAQSDLISAQEQLDDLYQNFDKNKTEAQLAVITAQEELDDLLKDRNWLNYPRCDQDTIDDYQDQYQDAVDRVSDLEGRYAENPDNGMLHDMLINARSTRDTAYANYSYCSSPRKDSEIDKADTEIALAQAKLDLAKREYDGYAAGKPADNDVATLENRIKAAEATLAMISIHAPFAGTVTNVDILPGDQVNAGSTAMRIDDLSSLLVDLQISEIDINRIQTGQQVVFTFDAIPNREYHGEVTEIAAVGSSMQGVVEFTVTTTLLDADEDIKPGMTAIAEIVVSDLEDALLVPNQAIRVVDGSRVVYILKADQTIEMVAIELGIQSLNYSQVTGGSLEVGDQIILNPPKDVLSWQPSSGQGFGSLMRMGNGN